MYLQKGEKKVVKKKESSTSSSSSSPSSSSSESEEEKKDDKKVAKKKVQDIPGLLTNNINLWNTPIWIKPQLHETFCDSTLEGIL